MVLGLSPEQIGALPPLVYEDFYLIGVLIQTLNFVDLNLRRALEIFLAHGFLSKKNLMSAHDADVLRVAREVITGGKVEVTGEIDVVLAFQIFEYGKEFRNLAAHSAAKRFPNENVIVFAFKNDRDAKQSLGKKLELQRVAFAVADRQKVVELVREIVRYGDWLANQIPYWSDLYLKPS